MANVTMFRGPITVLLASSLCAAVVAGSDLPSWLQKAKHLRELHEGVEFAERHGQTEQAATLRRYIEDYPPLGPSPCNITVTNLSQDSKLFSGSPLLIATSNCDLESAMITLRRPFGEVSTLVSETSRFQEPFRLSIKPKSGWESSRSYILTITDDFGGYAELLFDMADESEAPAPSSRPEISGVSVVPASRRGFTIGFCVTDPGLPAQSSESLSWQIEFENAKSEWETVWEERAKTLILYNDPRCRAKPRFSYHSGGAFTSGRYRFRATIRRDDGTVWPGTARTVLVGPE